MNLFKHLYALALTVLLTAFPITAWPEWINLTGAETSPNIAEIYVMDDHVKVKLEVNIGDLQSFRGLITDDWIKDQAIKRAPVEERISHFATNTLKFTTNEGETLAAELVLVEPRMRVDRRLPFAGMISLYTRQRVPEPSADERVLYAEIIYPFEGKPDSIIMVPPLDVEGLAKVTLGFIAYHKSVPVTDYRYLEAPATLNLDWADPWHSRFDNPSLKRHHASATMSFLYIEPHEVRHEIMIRVKDLENWMDLGLRGDTFIEPDELEDLKQRIAEFLLARNTVKVDDEALEPVLDRSNYITVDVTGIRILQEPQRLEISTAVVGVIITYLTDGMPQQVTVDWDLFTDQIQRVPATAIDPAGPMPTYLTPDDNVHAWTNFLKNVTPPTVKQVAVRDTVGKITLPVVSIGAMVVVTLTGWWIWQLRRQQLPYMLPSLALVTALVIALAAFPHMQLTIHRPAAMVGDLSTDETKLILKSLLKNVYRSFDFRDESDVYDKLALSVQGDLLEKIVLQMRRSLSVNRAGDTQARVNNIEILEATAEPLPSDDESFRIRAKWTAQGAVGHWGHMDIRKNDVEAIVNIKNVDGYWMITDLDLLEQKRLDAGARPDSEDGNA